MAHENTCRNVLSWTWTKLHLFAHVSLCGSGWSRSEAFKSRRDPLFSTFFTQVHRGPICSEGIETLCSVNINTAQQS